MAASLLFDRPQSWAPSIVRFLDTDDALRLAQVRTLLAGGGWFEPIIASMGDGEGLHSHWSRLLDLPIAGLILAARVFFDGPAAEQFALLVWPKLVLFVFTAAFFRQMIRETSVEAALALAAMLWLSLVSLVQFQLTRIDHHNVQNACAALAIVLATSPLASARSAFAAGLIAGLGLAIGYEALPAMGLLAALLAICSLIDPRRRQVAQAFAVGLALALAAALILTVPPSKWRPVACDALGLNVVMVAVIGAAGLFAAGLCAGRRRWHIAALLATGGAAAAGFAAVDPVCLAGPFARIDPAMGPLWLNHVREARPLLELADTQPAMAFALAASMLACLAAQAAMAAQKRTASDIMRLTLLILLTIIGFRYIKFISYAQLLGFFCLARAAFELRWPYPQITPRAAAMLATLLATPIPLMLAASNVTRAETKEADAGPGCSAEKDFAALAALPSARILPQPNLGGVLSLLTHHQVMIGNYHRLDREIAKAAAIFASPVQDARTLLDDWKIDIVAYCAGQRFYALGADNNSFARAIESGEGIPAYLQPIDMGAGSGVKAWRVVRP
ncbi:MAG: hypothetical protein IOC90_04215 [Methylocystis sp.]|nr:hypothetical protein [Methylocystis sp.]MCA3584416.1 hypothetical protein [Methylocystis sp.]MCA3587221.1 hypothetical protein [Methylocystis sp.]MCA3592563.1 hypothetical protein [Methylocystis sp.]